MSKEGIMNYFIHEKKKPVIDTCLAEVVLNKKLLLSIHEIFMMI